MPAFPLQPVCLLRDAPGFHLIPEMNALRRAKPSSTRSACRRSKHAAYLRGLLSVHSRYGLHARGVAKRPFTPRAPTALLPPLPPRLLRVERTSSRAGVAPAVVQRLSRRTVSTVKDWSVFALWLLATFYVSRSPRPDRFAI